MSHTQAAPIPDSGALSLAEGFRRRRWKSGLMKHRYFSSRLGILCHGRSGLRPESQYRLSVGAQAQDGRLLKLRAGTHELNQRAGMRDDSELRRPGYGLSRGKTPYHEPRIFDLQFSGSLIAGFAIALDAGISEDRISTCGSA